jgi:hypothetical protein
MPTPADPTSTRESLQQRHCRAFYDLASRIILRISVSRPAWDHPDPLAHARHSTLTEEGIDRASFKQRTNHGPVRAYARGLHGRSGAGEAKTVRCANGAVLDVVADARPDSPTFGQVRITCSTIRSALEDLRSFLRPAQVDPNHLI